MEGEEDTGKNQQRMCGNTAWRDGVELGWLRKAVFAMSVGLTL